MEISGSHDYSADGDTYEALTCSGTRVPEDGPGMRRLRRRSGLRLPSFGLRPHPRCAPRSLTSFAPCGACVVGGTLSALALRVRQDSAVRRALWPCPSPGSRGSTAGYGGLRPPTRATSLALGTRSRPECGCSAGRFRDQEARQRPCCEGRSRQRACRNTPAAGSGRCGATSAPLEPPRADARPNQKQGGTERGRPLDPVRRRKHRRVSVASPRGAASRNRSSGRGLSTGLRRGYCRPRESGRGPSTGLRRGSLHRSESGRGLSTGPHRRCRSCRGERRQDGSIRQHQSWDDPNPRYLSYLWR